MITLPVKNPKSVKKDQVEKVVDERVVEKEKNKKL